MMINSSALSDFNDDHVVACIPVGCANYTGVATIHPIIDGYAVGQRKELEHACLFPMAMVKEAVADGSMLLEGGDWVVLRGRRDEAGNAIEAQVDYFSFNLDVQPG